MRAELEQPPFQGPPTLCGPDPATTKYVTNNVCAALYNILLPIPIRDPGWVKNQERDPGYGMKFHDHISESLETIFWVKNTSIL